MLEFLVLSFFIAAGCALVLTDSPLLKTLWSGLVVLLILKFFLLRSNFQFSYGLFLDGGLILLFVLAETLFIWELVLIQVQDVLDEF